METDSIIEGIKAAGAEAASLRVWVVGVDDPKSVALPKVRNKWSRVGKVLEALDVVRVEVIDKAGSVLGIVEAEEQAATYEPEDAPDRRELAVRESEARRDERMLSLLLKAQDVALSRRESEFRTVLASCTAMVTAQTTATRTIIETYQQQHKLALQASEALAAEGPEGGMLDKLMPALMPALLPMLQRAGLLPQAPPTPVLPARTGAPTQPMRPTAVPTAPVDAPREAPPFPRRHAEPVP